MKMRLLFAFASLLLLGSASVGNDQIRIGEVEFYGYQGLDLNEIRAAIPIHEGDELSSKQEDKILTRVRQAVEGATERPPTDVAFICCDSRGELMIYIGLQGKSSETFPRNPAPVGGARLPTNVLNLYMQFGVAFAHAVESGKSAEDDSSGYALSVDPALRSMELKMRDYAEHNETLLRRVLQSSSNADDREAAAEILGYANHSQAQIDSLVRASHDPDADVRNDAVRALWVLANYSQKVAARIPASGFVGLLNSGIWDDRNKASLLLMKLTQSRDPELLAELRARALPSLIEIARWRDTSHAVAARIILGRMAGIDETRLQKLAQADEVDTIVNSISK